MFHGLKARLTNLLTDKSAKQITRTDIVGDKSGLDVILGASESTLNSTTTPLNSAQTFTGTGEQNNFDHVGVVVKADTAGTMYFDFSSDGTNWDSTYPVAGFECGAGITEFHTAVKLGRYFRVRYVNNGSNQTYMRLYTYYGNNFVPSVTPLNQSGSIDNDAIMTRPTDFADEVIRGLRGGVFHFTKFGYREGLTAANGEETIWATTGNFTVLTAASTFTITYNSTNDGSDAGATGAKILQFSYIDSDGNEATATHTLSDTGSDVTSFTGLGINRVAVASSGSATYNNNDITITATTGGTTQAFVPANQSVTQQCIYHTGSNSYASAKWLYINVNKLSGGGSPRVTIKGYAYNRTVATRYEVFRHTIDTQSETTLILDVSSVPFRLSPGDVLYFVADTDTNNTNITMRFSVIEYEIS